ncbi:MAG: hypothetical protein A2Y03_08995 [Omnitrophica WOR_2 bacterium GWF2_38_59]|nr:hypothetical protein [Candidatus Omnitrophota bacterium]OGX24857.1 MAG: hypothetical protein A2Y03_08995 [Omnitrophica WOR_2 bacterium GWF2_38_59]OGX50559.1 MAG: hypothetical protein A2243_06365 [Omnitrophica WOR_2 bacterium RIFOXYA2_FULL_38_17]OGX57879.1 MAG: hypothetical protein A2447_08895 [Omnitrophica WOR_2 bacterium RIFOXYC2_FULL_38_12]OGX59002.1 MAG: hypothetical protein A2306_07215 [Omnitrophica WOR_2 bacterium RIFOXYB2_FULL_38_16]
MNKNTISRLGPIEARIIARLTYESTTLVSADDLDNLFKLSAVDRAKVVSRLKRKNILMPVKRGLYIFSPLQAGPSGRGIDEMLIPSLYFPKSNYYIGYSTMFNYYGLTEQIFQTMYVLNTSFNKQKIICGISFKFLKVSESRMYGIKSMKIKEQDVMISDKERTLIDLLYFNKPVGGLSVASDILKKNVQEKQCNVKKLISYASRFPNVTIRKRIGVLLESIGICDADLIPLLKSIKNTAISSLGKTRKGTLSKKWRVIIDASQG